MADHSRKLAADTEVLRWDMSCDMTTNERVLEQVTASAEMNIHNLVAK